MTRSRIHLARWIQVFDEKVPESNGCANAITAMLGEELAVAAFVHYAENKGWSVTRERGVVSRGERSGHRLDAWLLVQREEATPERWQVEVKNWSAHSLRSRPIGANESVSDYKILKWKSQWDDAMGLKATAALKVLTRMGRAGQPHQRADEALLIYWWPIGHCPECGELFTVKVPEGYGEFDHLWFFSVSLYFRRLIAEGQHYIDLELPEFRRCNELLNQLVTVGA